MTDTGCKEATQTPLSSEKWRSDTDFLNLQARLEIAEHFNAEGYDLEADRFCNCGRRIHVFEAEPPEDEKKPRFARQRPTGIAYGITETCKSRICDRCAESMYRRFRDQALEILEGLPKGTKRRISFLTLTFKKQKVTDAVIRQSVKSVRKFVNVFYGKYYHRYNAGRGTFTKTKSQIDCGAVAAMEIGKSGNLHYHLLVYGYYHPITFMSEVWKQITGDSYRIDIQAVDVGTRQSPKRASAYLLKHVRKPPRFDTLEQYVDYWLMLKGIRRLHTYGIFFGHEGWKPDRDPFVCPFTGRPLRYRGIACKGEVVFNFHAVNEEFEKTRDPTRFFEFLSQIIVKDQNGLQPDAPVDNPALDTMLYRDPDWQEEKPVRRAWCIRSRNICLDRRLDSFLS